MFGFGPGQSATSSYFSLEMHNILLEVFFEGGILGLTAFLSELLFSFFEKAILNYRDRHFPR